MVLQIFRNFQIFRISLEYYSMHSLQIRKKADKLHWIHAVSTFFEFFNLKDWRCSLKFFSISGSPNRHWWLENEQREGQERPRKRPGKGTEKKARKDQGNGQRMQKKWMNIFTVYCESRKRVSKRLTNIGHPTQTHAQRKTTINQLPFDKSRI